MAKCFQLVGQGVPVRTSDEDAFQIVDRDHDGQYCSKKLWRDWYAPSETFPGGRTPARGRLGPTGVISTVDSFQRHDQHKR